MGGRGRRRAVFMAEAQMRPSRAGAVPLDEIRTVAALQMKLRDGRIERRPTVAVFLTPRERRVPRSLGVLLAESGNLAETVVLLHVRFHDSAFVSEEARGSCEVLDSELGLFSMVLHFGYAEQFKDDGSFDVPKALAQLAGHHARNYPALSRLATLLPRLPSAPDTLSQLAMLLPRLPSDPDVVGNSSSSNNDCVTYVFNKTNVDAADSEREGDLECYICLYNLLARFACSPVDFFGLQECNVLEVPVRRLV